MSDYCKRGFVDISRYSSITDEYETQFAIKKYVPLSDLNTFLLVDSSSLDTIILNADTSSNVNGLNFELDLTDNLYYYGDSYGVSVALSSSIVVVEPLLYLPSDPHTRPFDLSFNPDPAPPPQVNHACPYTIICLDITISFPPPCFIFNPTSNNVSKILTASAESHLQIYKKKKL